MTALRLVFLSVALLSLGLLGCDTTATQPEEQVVVEAYLQADAPLPPIRLTRTVSVDETYDPDSPDGAVQNADVVVERLDSDDTVAESVPYTPHDSVPGLYTPAGATVVQPQVTYRLRVTTDEGDEITSTTTVPGPVGVVKTENDTAVYQSEQQPAITVQSGQSNVVRDTQNVFTFTTTSLLDFQNTPDTTLRKALTPFYADGFDPKEDSLESLRITSSGLLNEGNFERTDDGSITIALPWLAVAFFGPNEAAVNVVDKNYYDFLRSQSVQQGGFAPGEIPNVIEHVEGGTGLFGSYAQATNRVFITPPEQFDPNRSKGRNDPTRKASPAKGTAASRPFPQR